MKAHWTCDDIPSQEGRTAIVTGANSGLGYRTALILAQRGAEVILACRAPERGEEAAAAIRAECPSARLPVVALDLADLDSVAACAKEVRARWTRLDLLINNAGVMTPPLTRTRQGFELQFGVNHLGHFALTGRLLPLLTESGAGSGSGDEGTSGARIVSLSSIAAYMGGIDLDDPNYERRRYRKFRAYCASKLADQMFIQELARRLEAREAESGRQARKAGTEAGAGARKVIAVAAHPGISATNLFKNGRLGEWYASHLAQTPAMGALPVLRAACDPAAKNGSYWGPEGFLGISGYPAPARIPSMARDAAICHRLWEISEELTGVKY